VTTSNMCDPTESIELSNEALGHVVGGALDAATRQKLSDAWDTYFSQSTATWQKLGSQLDQMRPLGRRF
jgi:hypothetical protein